MPRIDRAPIHAALPDLLLCRARSGTARYVMSDRVPTRFVTTLLKMVGTRGYDFSHILTDAGLGFDPTDPEHPEYRAEISAMRRAAKICSIFKNTMCMKSG